MHMSQAKIDAACCHVAGDVADKHWHFRVSHHPSKRIIEKPAIVLELLLATVNQVIHVRIVVLILMQKFDGIKCLFIDH